MRLSIAVVLLVVNDVAGQVCSGGPTVASLTAGLATGGFTACNALSNGATCVPGTGGYSCTTGYTPNAASSFVLSCPATTYSAAGAQCNANSCPAGVATPLGAGTTATPVVTPVVTGASLVLNFVALTGYTCTGALTAVCATPGGAATIPTHSCAANQCNSLTAVTGASYGGGVPINTGQALTMTPTGGYVCTGTATAMCTVATGAATVQGYTCSLAQCQGGITSPTGASVTGTVPAVISNGDSLAGNLVAAAGYSCTGTPVAVCAVSSMNPVTVGGTYACTALNCLSISPPQGASVLVQRATATGSIETTNLAALTGFTCSGVATAACLVANGAASINGYTCTTLFCSSIQAPTGATVPVQQTVNHQQVVTNLLTPLQGYTCTGTGVASCPVANGPASVTGLTCVPIQCNTFTVPTGSSVVAQRTSSTGVDMTGSVSPQPGYSCTGTPTALCLAAGGVASLTGYTCVAINCNSFNGGTGTAIVTQGPVSTGANLVGRITPANGYSCTGTPLALCSAANGVASVTGYTCTITSCSSITAPTGTTVPVQRAVNNGDVVTNDLQVVAGYVCSGVATAACAVANGAATVTGYTCTLTQCSSIAPTVGSQVVTQRNSVTGDDLTANLVPTAGYGCTGTPRAQCNTQNGVASVTGYTCSALLCASVTAPTGSQVITQVAVATGTVINTNLQTQAGFTCTGTATAMCAATNAVATVSGYTCTSNFLCTSLTAPTGATVITQGGVNNGVVVTTRLAAAAGFFCVGTATSVCPVANGAATTTGYTCSTQCTSITAPTGAQVITQGAVGHGNVVTTRLAPAAGFTCSGTASAQCLTANGVATVTGYNCVGATQCASISAPTGAQVITQGAVGHGTIITTRLAPAAGFTCSGTASAQCLTANGVATVTGYNCVGSTQCASITAPTGAQVITQGAVGHGTVITTRLAPAAGFTCSGTASAQCLTANGVATVTGYNCVGATQCAQFAAPNGASVTVQGAVTHGQDLTTRMAAQAGYVCTGTGIASCAQAGGTATVTGYTCSTQCASITAPTGAQVITQGAVGHGNVVTTRLAPAAGFTCSGTASAQCLTPNGAATVTGYNCVGSTQCASISAPTGAQVITQGVVGHGTIITTRLAPAAGFTCSGTASAQCLTANGVATVTGYSCVGATQCAQFVAPNGASVTVQGAVTHGQDLTTRMAAQAGYVCGGTGIASCAQAGGTATVTGYTCLLSTLCNSLQAPFGAQVVTQGTVNNGDDVTARLVAQGGYTCSGRGVATCPSAAGVATVSGFACTATTACSSFVAPNGARVTSQGGVNNNQDVTGRLTALLGYTCGGTAIISCLQANGVASVSGYTCTGTTLCSSFTPPTGSQVLTQGGVNNGDVITNRIGAIAGFTCTGVATAVCLQAGIGSVSGFSCTANKLCTSLQAPFGAQVVTQGRVNNNEDVTAMLGPLSGYTCSGTGISICANANAVATVAANSYVCTSIPQCTSFQVPTGSQVTNQGRVNNNEDVSARVAALPGYTCTGVARTICPQLNAVATISSAYSCTQNTLCSSLQAPFGAQVITQGGVNNNVVVTSRLVPQAGYSCTGTAVSVCPQAGVATTTGYTCVLINPSMCASFVAPLGAQVTAQGGVNNNQDVTSRLSPLATYTCSGTAFTVCTQQNGVASVTGYTCTQNTLCTSFVAPQGALITNQVGVNNNQDVSAWVTPQAGYTCIGRAVTNCPASGGVASIVGYSCSLSTGCASFTAPPGSQVKTVQPVTNGQDATSLLEASAGYICTGTPRIVCSQAGGVASVTGYTCSGTGTFQCRVLAPPAGARVTQQGGVTGTQDVTGRIAPEVGYACGGTATASCPSDNGVAVTSGYVCTYRCNSIAALTGMAIAAQGEVSNGEIATTRVTSGTGYVCSGTPVARCDSAGGVASITGYTCLAAMQCASLNPPAGATVIQQGAILNGEAVTARLQAIQGSVCSGTAIAECTAVNGIALITGFACSTNGAQCSGGIVPPTGASLSGVAAPATIVTGSDISLHLQAMAGYTCTGTAIANCPVGGGNPVTTAGYNCVRSTRSCIAITDTVGATVTSQGSVLDGEGVGSRVAQTAGYTCVGVPVASCSLQDGSADIAGFSCTAESCGSVVAPTGADVAQGVSLNGADITSRLSAQAGYSCSGTAVAECSVAGGTAQVSGYTCTSSQPCAAGVNLPTGAALTGTTIPPLTTGVDLTPYITAETGYTCVNRPVASCTNAARADVTGLVCTSAQCSLPSTYPGYSIINNVVNCAGGFTGVVSIACPTQGGQFILSGCSSSSGVTCTVPTSTVGYVIQGGTTCNTAASCGTITCSAGYKQSGVPQATCSTSGTSFILTGCVTAATPVCSLPNLPGYLIGACTQGVTCANVNCAAGYTSSNPRVICNQDGTAMQAEGCTLASAAVSLPSRTWKRVRMAVTPPWSLVTAEQMSTFIIAVEEKLQQSYSRFFNRLAELRITLMCPAGLTPTSAICYRPNVVWRQFATVQQSGSGATQVIDIIVADDTMALVDEDIANLKLQVENAARGTGPIAESRTDFPLQIDTTTGFSTAVPDNLGVVPETQGGNPVYYSPAPGDDDDDSFPWWAILLIIIAVVLILCCIILLLFFCCKGDSDSSETHETKEMYHHDGEQRENPLDTIYGTPVKSHKSLDESADRTSSLQEAIRARQLREEIYVLEQQKSALSYGSSEEIIEVMDEVPPRSLTHDVCFLFLSPSSVTSNDTTF